MPFGSPPSSSPLAVLSVTGLSHLLENQDGSDKHIALSDAIDELVRALETAVAREDQLRLLQGGEERSNPDRGVTQCLTRCLVATCRLRLRHERRPQQPTTGGGGEGSTVGAGLGVTAMLLSLNPGRLYPALAHETTCFVSRFNADQREVVGVVGPLASTLLLQPECEGDLRDASLVIGVEHDLDELMHIHCCRLFPGKHRDPLPLFLYLHDPALLPPILFTASSADANLRGGFLLKLSTASATSSDAVKLGLVLLQAELLGFSAVHSPAHADLTAGWWCSLVNTSLSLDSDASWDRASRAIGGVAIFLLAEFRGDCNLQVHRFSCLGTLLFVEPRAAG